MSAKQSWQAGQDGAVLTHVRSPAVLTVWGWSEMASAGKLVPLAVSLEDMRTEEKLRYESLGPSGRTDTLLLPCGSGWGKAQGQAQSGARNSHHREEFIGGGRDCGHCCKVS